MLTLLLALTSTPAHALDCVDWMVNGSMPTDQATAVPTNAQITVRLYSWHEDPPAPVLFDAAGAVVTTTLDTHVQGTDKIFVLTPDADLAADSAYSVTVEHPFTDGPPTPVTSFTTGDWQDVNAPPEPLVNGVSASHETDEWGDWYSFIVAIDPIADESEYKHEVTLRDVNTDESFVRWQLTPGEAFHDNPCNTDLAARLDPTNTEVTVRSFDIAGNISGEEVIGPQPGDTGDTGDTGPTDSGGGGMTGGSRCDVAGAGAVGGLLFALPLLGLRRRES